MTMTPDKLAMLIGGIAVLATAIGLIIFCFIRKRNYKLPVILVLAAIIMIGFPSIKSFKLFGAEVELNDSLKKQQDNLNDPVAKADLARALKNIEPLVTAENVPAGIAETMARAQEALGKTDKALRWARVAASKDPKSSSISQLVDRTQISQLAANSAAQPTTENRVKLAAAVASLDKQPMLSAESHLVLAKAQSILGNQTAVESHVKAATVIKPALETDPRLRSIMKLTTP